MLTSRDLQTFILKNKVQAEIVALGADTPTVTAAAQVLGVHPDQIIKSLLFLADKKPFIVIAGLARINRKQLADKVQISRRRVKMASPAQVLAETGYMPGSVPPFGYRQAIPTIVETAVLNQEIIYGGGGDMNALVKLTLTELLRIVGRETADLIK